MRSAALLIAALLAGCAPAADVADGASGEAATAAANDTLTGQWRLPADSPYKASYSALSVDQAGPLLLSLSPAQGGAGAAIRMPLTEMTDGLYRIDWASPSAAAGTFPDNNETLCGAGGPNIPLYVRLRTTNGRLQTDFHKMDVAKNQPVAEPCLSLAWQR